MLNFTVGFLFLSQLEELLRVQALSVSSHFPALWAAAVFCPGSSQGWVTANPFGLGLLSLLLGSLSCVRYPPNLRRSLRQVLTNHSWHPPTAPDWQELTILINSEQWGAALNRLRIFRFRGIIWKQQEGAEFNLMMGLKPGLM